MAIIFYVRHILGILLVIKYLLSIFIDQFWTKLLELFHQYIILSSGPYVLECLYALFVIRENHHLMLRGVSTEIYSQLCSLMYESIDFCTKYLINYLPILIEINQTILNDSLALNYIGK